MSDVLIGRTFGRLRVLRHVHKDVWLCRCECQKEKPIRRYNLEHGLTRSCGCLRRAAASNINRTHGQSRPGRQTAAYQSFRAAKRRCNSTKDQAYRRYGGRGIKFLFAAFEDFFAELGPRPQGKTLDRIDNDGHYAPGNVKWSTPKEQRANQSGRHSL